MPFSYPRLAIGVAAAIVAAASLLAAGACREAAAHCPVCDRHECRNMAFTIKATDGRTVRTCCPRCGLHFVDSERIPVASLTVRDFESAAELTAETAVYVEGSDVVPCAAGSSDSSRPRDERGCCLNTVYDRCQPSVLAFSARARAEMFIREHGGDVRSLAEIRAGRKRQVAPKPG